MNLLAIDPGTTAMGLANRNNAWVYTVGGSLEKRLHFMMASLESALDGSGYDTVAFERSFMRGRASTQALYGIQGIIMALAERYDCAVLPIEISAWKKWAKLQTGTKAADDKNPTIILAEELSGQKGLNEHEADAIVIWHYVMANAVREDGTK